MVSLRKIEWLLWLCFGTGYALGRIRLNTRPSIWWFSILSCKLLILACIHPFYININTVVSIVESKRFLILRLHIRLFMILAISLKISNLLVLFLFKLRNSNFLSSLHNNLFLCGLNVFDLLDFSTQVVVLLLDSRELVGYIRVVCKYMVKFIVNGEVVGPHFVMQILMVFFYFRHPCILNLLLDSSVKRFL